LARALIALTLEKGYDAVTIRDLTERAGVGYATFFRHYRDKDALLGDVLDVVLEEFTGRLNPAGPAATDPETVGVLLFGYVQDQSKMVRVLLDSRDVVQRLIAAVTRQIEAEHCAQPGGAVPLDVAAYHIASASIALILWWLEQGMPYPPEQMGRIYRDLIIGPAAALAFAP
jgi:AcrR family transcriptional regulator